MYFDNVECREESRERCTLHLRRSTSKKKKYVKFTLTHTRCVPPIHLLPTVQSNIDCAVLGRGEWGASFDIAAPVLIFITVPFDIAASLDASTCCNFKNKP